MYLLCFVVDLLQCCLKCCDVCSGTATDTQHFESDAGSQSADTFSTVNSDRGNGSTDTESKPADCFAPVSYLPADEMKPVIFADHTESNDIANSHTDAETIVDDATFRVRRRRMADNKSSQVQKICEVCGKAFRKYETFRSHKRQKHAGQLQHCCNACQNFESDAGSQSADTFSTVNSDRGNGSTDTESKPADCFAPVSYLPADEMKPVIFADHTESNDIANSHIDAETVVDDATFRVRRRRMADNNSSQVQKICEVCGKAFRKYETFRSHKRRKHAGQLQHHCNACCKQFPQSSQACQHKGGSENPPRLLCEICGLRTRSCVAFSRHMRAFHPSAVGIDNAGAPYQCESCNEKFFEQRILRHHSRLVHSANLPRRKIVWFRRKQRIRNSEMPRCTYCYRCFHSRLALEVHERVHTGVKPYHCEVCGRCFRQKVHLSTHRRTHTNERPFTCSLCQKAYKNRVDLRKHSSKKHGVSIAVRRQRQRGVDGVDVVAAAVAAADIGQDEKDLRPFCAAAEWHQSVLEHT